jgi:hypothetical protein
MILVDIQKHQFDTILQMQIVYIRCSVSSEGLYICAEKELADQNSS